MWTPLAGAFDAELFKFDFPTAQHLEIVADVGGQRGSGFQFAVGAVRDMGGRCSV